MARGELHLWWTVESENIFVYYLTGAMALTFFVTVAIIRSLRRKESRVTELLHQDNLREMLVTYLLSVTTSLSQGSNCPDHVKVFVQLRGENRHSQFFALKSQTGGKPMFQRGMVDIFMFKVPVSLGTIEEVKLVLSGIDRALPWKISKLQLYDPATAQICDLPVTVLASEIMGFGDATEKIISLEKPYASWFLYVCIYHQWLAGFNNSVWFGAFTETVHVVSIYFTLFNIFTLAVIAFIVLPGGSLEDSFDINTSSMLIGSSAVSFICSLFCFGLELLIRNAKSQEKHPGSAYYTLMKENNYARNMTHTGHKEEQTLHLGNITTSFVLHLADIENISATSMVRLKESFAEEVCVPSYLAKLLTLLDIEEGSLRQLEQQRKALSEQGFSMLRLTNSVHSSSVSFLTTTQSSITGIEINIPMFSEICLNRMLSRHSSLNISSRSIASDDYSDILLKRHYHKSYFDILKSRAKHEYESDETSHNSDDVFTIYIRRSDDFPVEQQDSVENVMSGDQSTRKSWKKSSERNSLRSFNKYGNLEVETKGKQDVFKIQRLGKTIDLKQTGKAPVADSAKEKTTIKPTVDDNVSGHKSKEHIINIEEIVTEEVKQQVSVEETKINIADVREPPELDDQMALRRRMLPASKSPDMSQAFTDDESVKVSEESVDAGKTSKSSITPTVSFSLRSKKSTTKAHWLQWQITQKEWCRKVVQAVHQSFTSCRTDLLKDILATSSIDTVLLEWSHEVIKRIAVSCSMRRASFDKEILESENLLKLFTHMACEIILLVIRDVYQCLHSSESVALADLVSQSHRVMMAVEHSADCVTYILNHGLEKVVESFRYLDMGQDLLDIRDSFLQMCLELVVKHDNLTWPQFLTFLKDEKRQKHMLKLSIDRLVGYVESRCSQKNEEEVTVKNLCHSVITQAKCEVWDEFNSQEKMFTSMLAKQQILMQLSVLVKRTKEKKIKFDIKHDLIPAPPKSRLEKLVERRRKTTEKTDDKLKLTTSDNKDKMNEKTDNEKSEKAAENKIDKAACEIVSKELERYTNVLVYIGDTVQKKWMREGLKTSAPMAKYLAQALLHPDVKTDKTKQGNYCFNNFLHLKRAENFLQTFWESVVIEIVHVLLSDICKEHKLQTAELTDKQQSFVIHDLLAKVNMMIVILMQEVHSYTRQIVRRAASSTGIDTALVKRTSQLLIKQFSHVMNRNFSAIPASTEERTTVGNRKSSKKHEDNNKAAKSMDGQDGHAGSRSKKTSSDEVKTVSYFSDDNAGAMSVQNLIDELKPLMEYLNYMQKTESLHSRCTQSGYLERQKERREYTHSVSINNIIDSYYLIREGDDSHTFTQAGLYQLEYDIVGENSRPLPGCLKTLLICLMVVVILFNISYMTLVGRQFTTIQIQEWVCLCLLSLVLFGFVFEPVRAVVLGYIMEKSQELDDREPTG